MKTLNEIQEEMQANAAIICDLKDRIHKTIKSWATKTLPRESFEELATECIRRKKIYLILQNNCDCLKNHNFGKYIEDPAGRVAELEEKKKGIDKLRDAFYKAKKEKEIDETRNALNKAVDGYNVLTVNGINHEKRA